jgi:hypothetical protein
VSITWSGLPCTTRVLGVRATIVRSHGIGNGGPSLRVGTPPVSARSTLPRPVAAPFTTPVFTQEAGVQADAAPQEAQSELSRATVEAGAQTEDARKPTTVEAGAQAWERDLEREVDAITTSVLSLRAVLHDLTTLQAVAVLAQRTQAGEAGEGEAHGGGRVDGGTQFSPQPSAEKAVRLPPPPPSSTTRRPGHRGPDPGASFGPSPSGLPGAPSPRSAFAPGTARNRAGAGAHEPGMQI